ncbi:hypothetical protein C8R47DRAFT_1128047 [Mycena vitilis]|nr:hypothetical protein C8R47DRAFT_1128047 [Mycena vitilis]
MTSPMEPATPEMAFSALTTSPLMPSWSMQPLHAAGRSTPSFTAEMTQPASENGSTPSWAATEAQPTTGGASVPHLESKDAELMYLPTQGRGHRLVLRSQVFWRMRKGLAEPVAATMVRKATWRNTMPEIPLAGDETGLPQIISSRVKWIARAKAAEVSGSKEASAVIWLQIKGLQLGKDIKLSLKHQNQMFLGCSVDAVSTRADGRMAV